MRPLFLLSVFSIVAAPAAAQGVAWELIHPASDYPFWEVHVTERGTVVVGDLEGASWRLEDGTWQAGFEVGEPVLDLFEDHGVLYAATGEGLYRSLDEGATWAEIMPSFTEAVYVVGDTIAAGGGGGQFFLSRDAGRSWSVETCDLQTRGIDFSVNPVFQGTGGALFGHFLDGVFTRQGAAGWVQDRTWAPTFVVPGRDGYAYAARLSTVVRTRDGVAWEPYVEPPLFAVTGFAKRGDLLVADELGDLIYSTDGGANWQALSGLPPSQVVVDFALGPDRRLYVGTDCCVYRTRDPLAAGGGVAAERRDLPQRSELRVVYPNPVRDDARVRFVLARPGRVALEVYDAAGRRVDMLVDRLMAAGGYEVRWRPARLPSGTYFIRMTEGMQVQTRTVTVVR